MKKIIIILLFAPFYIFGQTPAIDTLYIVDTTRLDTIPVLFPVLDTTHNFDVYNSQGKLLKHNADSFYPVPTGGYRIKLGFANPIRQFIEGYEVYRTRLDFNMEVVADLNFLKEPIKPPLVLVGVAIPRSGFTWIWQ